MNCAYCFIERSRYNVVAPVCMNGDTVPLCPSCFQRGIDEGMIVWLGNKPYGICDCEEEEVDEATA